MMSNLLILLVIILAVLVGVLILKKYVKRGSPAAYPYQSKTFLCSAAERSLLGVLDQLLSDKYRVLLKVSLADLLEIPKGVSNSLRQSAFNRISRKHVDFVVCDKNDLSILGVIELDDHSHKSSRRRKRDSFLDGALNAAGIPILRIQAQSAYSVIETREHLQNSFMFLADNPNPESPHNVTDSEHRKEARAFSDDTETIEICEDCGAALVKRQAKKGKFAGEYFLACSNFPKCRKIVPLKKAAD
ncbi:MAG: DUF2726 domain-containing protein [Desulfobacterales bacterium]|nr:MAG: DUF2726 domain-containing protein [Desulfobacterales bacterium]